MEKITAHGNSKVKQLKGLINDKKSRVQSGFFVADNYKLYEEGAKRGILPVSVFATGAVYGKHPELLSVADKYEITPDIAISVSDLKTPQGLFAVYRADTLPECKLNTITTAIYLDNISDPGNLGSILRTSAAFRIGAVILSEMSADELSPKVIRAAMGATFNTPVLRDDGHAISALHADYFTLYAAMLDPSAKDYRATTYSKKTCIVLGNEAHGVSPPTADQCDYKTYIPITGVQSLGVAAAAAIFIAHIH
jgi:TrmH family RNA methyltransferase